MVRCISSLNSFPTISKTDTYTVAFVAYKGSSLGRFEQSWFAVAMMPTILWASPKDKAHCALKCSECGHKAGVKDSTVLSMANAIYSHHLKSLQDGGWEAAARASTGASSSGESGVSAAAAADTGASAAAAANTGVSAAAKTTGAWAATTTGVSAATNTGVSAATIAAAAKTTVVTAVSTTGASANGVKKKVVKTSSRTCVKACMPIQPHYLNHGASIDIEETQVDNAVVGVDKSVVKIAGKQRFAFSAKLIRKASSYEDLDETQRA